jgi:hypothetical protein
MKNLKDINKIKRLAEKFNTPIDNVEFVGDGIVFTYKIGFQKVTHSYSDADRGIQEEVIRLRQLLAIQI